MADTPNTNIRLIDGVEAPAPGDWAFDAAHTNIMFVARYAMLTKVRGRFNTFDGTIHVAERPEHSWVEVRIDASSISTDNEQRDAHLRSGDFLDLENEPDITFRSTSVERAEGNRFRLTGTFRSGASLRKHLSMSTTPGWPSASTTRPGLRSPHGSRSIGTTSTSVGTCRSRPGGPRRKTRADRA